MLDIDCFADTQQHRPKKTCMHSIDCAFLLALFYQYNRNIPYITHSKSSNALLFSVWFDFPLRFFNISTEFIESSIYSNRNFLEFHLITLYPCYRRVIGRTTRQWQAVFATFTFASRRVGVIDSVDFGNDLFAMPCNDDRFGDLSSRSNTANAFPWHLWIPIWKCSNRWRPWSIEWAQPCIPSTTQRHGKFVSAFYTKFKQQNVRKSV